MEELKGRQAAASLMPDVTGRGSGSLLEPDACLCLWKFATWRFLRRGLGVQGGQGSAVPIGRPARADKSRCFPLWVTLIVLALGYCLNSRGDCSCWTSLSRSRCCRIRPSSLCSLSCVVANRQDLLDFTSLPLGNVFLFYFIFRKCFFSCSIVDLQWLPWWLRRYGVRLQCGRPRLDPWAGKIPWGRKGQPTPLFLPGISRGWRSLRGSSPWGHKELDMTEGLHWFTMLLLVSDVDYIVI